MRKENIEIIKELYVDDYCINDLDARIDNVRNGRRPEYNGGYYMGYISSLYDMGHINHDDIDSLASEVELCKLSENSEIRVKTGLESLFNL